MIWPFENDTSNVIKKLAKKSVYFDKNKNILCILSIIVSVSMIMMSFLTVQNIINQQKSELDIFHQGTFFDITQSDKEKLLNENYVDKVGLSCNIKSINNNSQEYQVIYYDKTMSDMISNLSGRFPKEKNEIVVTDKFFKDSDCCRINTNIKLNIDGFPKYYTIVGIINDDNKNSSASPIFVSLDKCKELRGNNLLNGYIWLNDADTFSKDEATEILSQISKNTSLDKWSISNYYDYVNTDISVENYTIYISIATILFLAAALVIYSIFYISVEQKISEFGRLRTIGTSKKQIYKIVLRQGYILAFPSISIGCILGSMVSYFLQQNGWNIKSFIFSLIASFSFGLLLVYISVYKPARIAANTSPISALNNHYEIKKYKSHKNHHISALYLAKINFLRNRKKSFLTVFSMGLCGISFFFAASYQSSFNAESMVRYWDIKNGDFKISVDLENNDIDLNSVLQKEYFSIYKEKIINIEGIDTIFSNSALPAVFFTNDNIKDNTLLLGYNQNDIEGLKSSIIKGSINGNTELIVSNPERVYDIYHWKPEIGDEVVFTLKNKQNKSLVKSFKISAITSDLDKMGGYIFRIPEKNLKDISGYDCTYSIEILEKPGYYNKVEHELEKLISSNKDLQLYTITDFIEKHQNDNNIGITLGYIIAIILCVFSIINQINLTITNLLSRKREIGILKAVGITSKQLELSFMLEGFGIILLSILLTCFVGIPGGYMIANLLEKNGMSSGFVFPIHSFILFISIMLIIECIITILIVHSLKRKTVIDILYY